MGLSALMRSAAAARLFACSSRCAACYHCPARPVRRESPVFQQQNEYAAVKPVLIPFS